MSTPLLESLKQLEQELTETNQPPTSGRSKLQAVRDGIRQGATRANASHPDDDKRGASVDLDRENTTKRDRLTPRVQVTLPTYILTGGQQLTITLPRWARQVIIQNNTDLSGATTANVSIFRSLDGTPANPGDYAIRPGQTVSDDVFTNRLSLYSASTNTINGNIAGIVIEVSS